MTTRPPTCKKPHQYIYENNHFFRSQQRHLVAISLAVITCNLLNTAVSTQTAIDLDKTLKRYVVPLNKNHSGLPTTRVSKCHSLTVVQWQKNSNHLAICLKFQTGKLMVFPVFLNFLSIFTHSIIDYHRLS